MNNETFIENDSKRSFFINTNESMNVNNEELNHTQDKIFTLADNTRTINDNEIQSSVNMNVNNDKKSNEKYYKGTLDGFMNQVPLSFYTAIVFLLFAILIMVDGGEMTVISLLVTKLGASWKLTNFEKGIMGSSVFIGFFAGTLFSGKMSDISGRKPMFVVGNFIVSIFAIASAFSPNYIWFTVFRGFCGLGIGLSLPASSALSTEICPAQYRGFLINLLAIFFPLGEIITALIAKSVLNDKENGWRVLLAIIAAPMIFALIISIFIRESPRFLANNREFNRAYLEIDRLLDGNVVLSDIDKFNIKQEIILMSENNEIESSYLSLFNKKYLCLSLSVSFILFTCSFIYYGVVYILPEGLEKNFHHSHFSSNSTMSSYSNSTSLTDSSKPSNIEDGIQNNTDLSKVFNGIIYSALSEIPAPLFSMLLVNIKILGRRYSLAISLIIVVVFSLLCAQFNSSLTVFASLLKFGINIPFSIAYLYISEVFPTKIRSIAIGFTNSFTRIGGIITPVVSQWLFEFKPFAPYLLFSVVSGLASLCAFTLQIETYGKILE